MFYKIYIEAAIVAISTFGHIKNIEKIIYY
jgi:hypothetical protein